MRALPSLQTPRWYAGGFAAEPAVLAVLLFALGWLFDLGLRDASKMALVFLSGAWLLMFLPLPARPRAVAEDLWRLSFALDLMLRASLMGLYRTQPDSALVLEAIGNTSEVEAWEFMHHNAARLGLYVLLGLGFAAVALESRRRRRCIGSHAPRRWRLAMLMLLFAALHVNSTLRASNPFASWWTQATGYKDYQAHIGLLAAIREASAKRVEPLDVRYDGPARNTLAFVIGESVNRNDWSLYGYGRTTSPLLQRRAGELVVFRDVLAAYPATVGAVQMMLTCKDRHSLPGAEPLCPSVTMLAKAAGYKTFWISNQHDRYINKRFAQEADVRQLVNTGGRRGDRSLDERLGPAWQAALDDPAPRKLIIVHLLGAHPNYADRRPDAFARFNGIGDSVSRRLRQEGRMPWIVAQRDEYDNALLYHDHVVAGLLEKFVRVPGEGPRNFLYTSDHGQEVGHTRNYAGHTDELPGYEVPMLLWTSTPMERAERDELAARPYQNDLLEWTLLDLLGISIKGGEPWHSVVGPAFRESPRGLGWGG
ncbi:Phosphoethanolamine transferase EptC [Variovorax sp. WDL1]|nr:Phosphoethanolamine transferase EptC [Variovorax sp. B4]PNG54572.1 Phosphoethanolamine transferase EptC [Variovorax sp. B2]VTV15545.1 Phosphoethanolamine transferase EptC [Variovorax sp. WDL1]